jgi:DNA-directed RNA polymerase beta' subunit
MSTHEIGSISFGLLSAEEIEKTSVCLVDKIKMSGPGSVYDAKMGTIDHNKQCESCGKNNINCPGHFGHIHLNAMIVHPMPVVRRDLLTFLRLFCIKCSRLTLSPGQENILKPSIIKGADNFKWFKDFSLKILKCAYCKNTTPLYKYFEGKYVMSESRTKKNINYAEMDTKQIYSILEKISVEDVKRLGIDTAMFHPKNIIIRNLPVCPPSTRPYSVEDNVYSDDDITTKYVEIIKQNNRLKDNIALEETKKITQILEFHIKSLMDNSDNKAKHANGRPHKSIKQRLNGKGNLIRSNITGKRTDFSGRTVAGPDPSLYLDEVGIPPSIMKTLTIPERVFKYNKSYLEECVQDGKANSIIRNGKILSLKYLSRIPGTRLQRGDVIKRDEQKLDPFKGKNFEIQEGDVIIRNGETIKARPTKKKPVELQIGDIVELHLREGDHIVVNRQPTLHLGSMMAFRIKKIPGKTVRIPLAVTGAYNCDFDGDELNLHAPQNTESITECKILGSVKNNLMSCKNNKPLVSIVQDAVVGSYLMTLQEEPVDMDDFFDITTRLCGIRSKEMSPDYVLDGMERYQKITKKHGTFGGNKFNSRCLWSLILPYDFDYKYTNNGKDGEPTILIEDGIIYKGVLDKRVISKGNYSITQLIYLEYGADVTINFLSNVQFITDSWLVNRGFSIGIKECYADRTKVIETVEECFDQADKSVAFSTSELLREGKINAALNKARDIGIKMSRNNLKGDNSLNIMISSGAKGDFVNIAQISGVLGQQNLNGRRIEPIQSEGLRTLSQYPFEITERKYKYESRGFIAGSFLNGLNPCEFFFHAMSGREGLVNTSCKTAISGYIQRRMVKMMEDIQVSNDMTVRNKAGNIIQFNYGNDNHDPKNLIKKGGKLTPFNVDRICNRLNKKYEKSLSS